MPGLIEWLLVGLILVILLLSPSKIVDLARALGKAAREFKAGLRSEAKEAEEAIEQRKGELIELARKLGIDVEGKTLDEIVSEIAKKLKIE